MMSQRDVWSLSLGRWGHLHVRLHIFFVLFGVFTAYLAWQEQTDEGLMPLAIVSVTLLFISVLIHELGHYFASRSLGGHIDTIVLGPVGGLRPVRIPRDPQSELVATLAGPFTTLTLALMSLGMALAIGFFTAPEVGSLLDPLGRPDALSFSLFNPFASIGSQRDLLRVSSISRLLAGINAWLFVVNLIPAFPFDGGRAAAALIKVLRPQITPDRAISLVATFARLVAIALFIAAVFLRNAFTGSVVPAWLALLLLSVFVFFSARVEEYQFEAEEEDDELFGYDFSQGYTSLERSTEVPVRSPGPFTRWWNAHKEKRRVQRIEREAAEDRESDDILARLHEVGMQGLTARERALLKRVSERLRAREQE